MTTIFKDLCDLHFKSLCSLYLLLLLQQPGQTKTSMTAFCVQNDYFYIFSSPLKTFIQMFLLLLMNCRLITESTPVSASLPILAAFLLITMFYVHVPRSTFLHIPWIQFPLTFSETPLLRYTFLSYTIFSPSTLDHSNQLKKYLSISMFKNFTSTPHMPFLSSSSQ